MSDSSCTVGVLWQHLPWTEHEHNLSGTWAWSLVTTWYSTHDSITNIATGCVSLYYTVAPHKHQVIIKKYLLLCLGLLCTRHLAHERIRWRVLEFSWCCSTCMIQQKWFLNNTLTNFGAIQGDKSYPYFALLILFLWSKLNRNYDKNLPQH